MPRYDTISFLSDYGLVDEFVGVCKSVIRTIAPHAAVIDITHDIPAHDIRAGSLALVRSVQYLAPGVVLAVVDPGVGTERRAVAIEVGEHGEAVLVGPDNGLLAAAVAMTGGAGRVVALANTEYQLPAPGPTFAGRDIFAPAAAHLAAGVPLDELGPPVDAYSLMPGLIPLTGMPMPFLAQGGSSVVTNWIIVALLIRLSDSARRQDDPGPFPQSPRTGPEVRGA